MSVGRVERVGPRGTVTVVYDAHAQSIEIGALLDSIVSFARRFVSLSQSQARAIALWIVHTHTIDAADATPYLAITSAEKESGKTRTLEVCDLLVANPWFTGRVTAAVLIRKIDAERPTLLLDESDAAFSGEKEYAEALRGVLNTGHRRKGKASACVGQGSAIGFRDFSTFCPKAIAGIGNLPDTVSGRSIPIRLKRAMRAEQVERFRHRHVEAEASGLRRQIEKWATTAAESLRNALPELPSALTDRQQDGAEPLLAIADLAGGEWPEAARRALVSLFCGAHVVNDSIGTLLLSDIRQIFRMRNADRLPSAELASELAEIETSPWGEWSHSRPITPVGVARLLKPFDISPRPVRNDDRVFRGYEKADFGDAWGRYLAADCEREYSPAGDYPGPTNVTALQAAPGAGSSKFRGATADRGVTVHKIEKPALNAPCNAVAPSRSPARAHGTEEEL